MAARKKAASAGTRSGRVSKRARGKLAPGGEARGLDAAQVAIALESPEIADLAALVRAAGGAPVGAYHEPLGGGALMLVSLPIQAVHRTPLHRDLPPTHPYQTSPKSDE